MGKKRRRHQYQQGSFWRQEVGGAPYWFLAAAALALVGFGAFVAVSYEAPASNATSTPRATPTAESHAPELPRTVAVVGDSNTEVDSPDFASGDIGTGSWVHTLLSQGGYAVAGGWADGGTTSIAQAEGLTPVPDPDVLLVMTGTNDLGLGLPFEQTATSLQAMADKAPADRVVLLAIPPRDAETDPSSADFNASLQQLAADRGWDFFDGLQFLRAPGGGFVDGMTSDGVHLTREAQIQFGQTVRDYLND